MCIKRTPGKKRIALKVGPYPVSSGSLFLVKTFGDDNLILLFFHPLENISSVFQVCFTTFEMVNCRVICLSTNYLFINYNKCKVIASTLSTLMNFLIGCEVLRAYWPLFMAASFSLE